MSRYDPRIQEAYILDGRRTSDPVSEEWERLTLRATLVVGLGILLGALSLLIADVKSLTWIGFLAGGLLGLLLLTRFFHASLVVLLAVCWINIGSPPIAQGGSGGGEQRLFISHLGLAALLLIWTGRLIFRRGEKIDWTELFAPMLAYLLVCLWSTANSLLFPNQVVLEIGKKQYFQVNLIEIITRVLPFGGLLLTANVLRGKMLKAALVAVALPGVLSLIGGARFIPTASDWFGFPQTLSTVLLAAVALDNRARKLYRLLAGAVALALFGLLFLLNTEWVSGWMGAIIGLAVVTYHSQRRLFWGSMVAVGLIVLLNLPYFYQKVYVENFYTREGPLVAEGIRVEDDTLDNDRLRMLRAAARYAAAFPLGIGCGNFRSYNDYFGRPDVWNTTTFTSAHGTYTQTLSETGWPGLITLLWLLAAILKLLGHYYRTLPEGEAKTTMLGIRGGVTGLFVASFNGDYLFPTYYNGGMAHFGVCVYVWLLIGIAIAIAREQGLEAPRPIGKRRRL